MRRTTDDLSSSEGPSGGGQRPFQIEPVRPVSDLLVEAAAASPPDEVGDGKTSNLVNLRALDSSLTFDLVYATDRNFLGSAVYPVARAYLQLDAARSLSAAADDLRTDGFGLVVYDAYRPWYITKVFWDATPERYREFLASPESGSRHNRGAAVDVGLYDLATGERTPMPSGFDEFTRRAYTDYDEGPEGPRRNRERLRRAMESNGFRVYDREWWHYDFTEWNRYPLLNTRLDELE